MHARRYIWIGLLVLFIAAGIFLLAKFSSSAPDSLAISFTGYTNPPNTQLRFAVFSIVNRDRWPVRWRGIATELEGDHNLKASVFNPSLPSIQPWPVKSGDLVTVAVGEPLDLGKWRVQLQFSRCTLKERLYQFVINHRVPSALSRFVPDDPPIFKTNSLWLTR